MLTPTILWHRLWAYRRIYWLQRGSGMTASLSSPMAGQAFVHQLLVRGAVATGSEAPFELVCRLGGKRVASWPITPAPGSDGRYTTPFEATVPGHELPEGTWLWLRLSAARADQPEQVLDAFPVRRVQQAPARRPRHEYGPVWDDEVHDMASARVAVAGYDDEQEWQRSGRATAEHVRTMLGLGRADTVLEIGCGAGRVGVHLAGDVGQWIGGDTSRKMLAHASAALAGRANVRLVHLNGHDLHGVGAESVDGVYCTAVFMHLDEWDRYRYVLEAHRVLRPGGRLYVDNFDLRSPDGWALFLDMAKLDPAVRPANVSKASTEQELTWYVEKAGFRVTQVDTGKLFVTVVGEKVA